MKQIHATARTESGTDLGTVTLTERGDPKRVGYWLAEIVFHDIELTDPHMASLRRGGRLRIQYEGRDRIVSIEPAAADDVRIFVFCADWLKT